MGDALRLSESAPGDRHMLLVRASALNGSAWNSVQLGDLSVARAFCLKAIELCQAIGYSPGEAGTWDTLGVVLQRLGSHAEAVPCFLRAVSLDREMGNRYDLAMVLAHLGRDLRRHRRPARRPRGLGRVPADPAHPAPPRRQHGQGPAGRARGRPRPAMPGEEAAPDAGAA